METAVRRLIASTLLLLACAAAQGEVFRVGPREAIRSIADAARVAKAGDVVEIQPGSYRGDVAVWTQAELTIRGAGERPVLLADGQSAEGKAIWVIRGGDIRVENIEFRGSRVPDGNGAGIRFERGRLTVSRCAFVDNQTGILTSNDGDAELAIEDSLFAQAPRQQFSLPHLLYVGRINAVSIRGSRFHNGHYGHLIKSRARHSDIRYNLIHDGADGAASYEIDLPNGGIAWVVGNVVSQSAATQNAVVVSYGAEGKAWPDSALYLSHNTLVSAHPRTRFLHAWPSRLPPDAEVHAVNNLAVGPGTFASDLPGRFEGNVLAPAGTLTNPAGLDFTLPANAAVRERGVAPGFARGRPLAPDAEFALPVGTVALPPPARWTPGAFQTAGFPPRADGALESAPREPGRPSSGAALPKENE